MRGGFELDAYWERFKIGHEMKVMDQDGKKIVKANPVATLAPGTPARWERWRESLIREVTPGLRR